MSTTTPTLLTPSADTLVDGASATFAWTDVPGATDFRLQIATDEAFEQPLHTLHTGPTTLLTLYELLPVDGSAFYCRVQALTSGGEQPWSTPIPFKTGTDLQARSGQTRRSSSVAPIPRQTTATPSTTPLPAIAGAELYQTGRTNKGVMGFMLAIMLLSFAAIFIYIVYAVNTAS